MDILLRDYQEEAIQTFFEKLKDNVTRPLIVLPTGAGKTIVASALAKRFHSEISDKPILFLAHRDELLEQTRKKMKTVWKDVTVGKVKGKSNEQEGKLIVASTPTLVRGRKLNFEPSLIIYDEAHHARAKRTMQMLEELGVFKQGGPPLLGITATPNRSDNEALGDVFEDIIYQKTIIELILAGYLTNVWGLRIKAIELDLNKIRTKDGDFKQNELSEAMSRESVVDDVVNAYLTHAKERKTVIFTAGVDQAYKLAERLREEGITAAAIDGSLDSEKRQEILDAFAEDQIKVLINCMILTEGFDEPSVSCVIVARPTKSEGLYTQIVGRGTRLHPEKRDLLVIDIVGASDENSLITLPKLFPMKKSIKKSMFEEEEESYELEEGETVLDFISRVEDEEISAKKKLIAEKVNLFSARSLYVWTKVFPYAYYLGLGNVGSAYLLKDKNKKWWPIFEKENETFFPLFDEPLELEFAQGIAESYLHLFENPVMMKDAGWRSTPISPGQKKTLEKFNIPYEDNWTKGEASDALGLYFGKQRAKLIVKDYSPIRIEEWMKEPGTKEKFEEARKAHVMKYGNLKKAREQA